LVERVHWLIQHRDEQAQAAVDRGFTIDSLLQQIERLQQDNQERKS
jgi:hypothetical protein